MGKIWLLSFVNLAAVTMSDIKKLELGTPNFFLTFIEINNKQTFWPRFTEVVLLLVGQILNTVKI